MVAIVIEEDAPQQYVLGLQLLHGRGAHDRINVLGLYLFQPLLRDFSSSFSAFSFCSNRLLIVSR
jgi:hypothetical protein